MSGLVDCMAAAGPCRITMLCTLCICIIRSARAHLSVCEWWRPLFFHPPGRNAPALIPRWAQSNILPSSPTQDSPLSHTGKLHILLFPPLQAQVYVNAPTNSGLVISSSPLVMHCPDSSRFLKVTPSNHPAAHKFKFPVCSSLRLAPPTFTETQLYFTMQRT